MSRYVRMAISISGSRHDDRSWRDFPAGALIEVAEWEADGLVSAGQAVEVPAEELPLPAPPPVPDTPFDPEPEDGRSWGSDGTELEPESSHPEQVTEDDDRLEAVADGAEDPAGDDDEEPGEPVAPRVNDPKSAWVQHAVDQGEDPATAASKTKEQLQSRYGGRL